MEAVIRELQSRAWALSRQIIHEKCERDSAAAKVDDAENLKREIESAIEVLASLT